MDAWGHEYVRHLAGEIVAEWNDLTTETADGKSRQSVLCQADETDFCPKCICNVVFTFHSKDKFWGKGMEMKLERNEKFD